jgi:hypothetical protein
LARATGSKQHVGPLLPQPVHRPLEDRHEVGVVVDRHRDPLVVEGVGGDVLGAIIVADAGIRGHADVAEEGLVRVVAEHDPAQADGDTGVSSGTSRIEIPRWAHPGGPQASHTCDASWASDAQILLPLIA